MMQNQKSEYIMILMSYAMRKNDYNGETSFSQHAGCMLCHERQMLLCNRFSKTTASSFVRGFTLQLICVHSVTSFYIIDTLRITICYLISIRK